jgi:hypothetical protein
VYSNGVLAGLLVAYVTIPLGAADLRIFSYHLGGGFSNPVQRTADYAAVSGTISAGVDYNFDRHNSLGLEGMWAGLPHRDFASQVTNAPFGRVNLYSLTAEYRYKIDRLGGSHFGVYAIGGGGWYYKYISVNASYTAAPNTPCQPIFTWWGFACQPNGFINPGGMTYKFESAGGVNGGAGATIRLGESAWKIYTESRYHHAFSTIPTSLVQVTFGFRYN